MSTENFDLFLTSLSTKIQANTLFDYSKIQMNNSSENNLDNINSLSFYLMLLYKQRYMNLYAYTSLCNETINISKFIYYVHIKFTKLNIFVTVSNTIFEPCFSFSLGQLKLKSAIQRKTHFAFKMLVKTLMSFLTTKKAYYYYLNFKGSLMLIKKYFIRFLTLRERDLIQSRSLNQQHVMFNALNINIQPNEPHGGCRPRHTPRK